MRSSRNCSVYVYLYSVINGRKKVSSKKEEDKEDKDFLYCGCIQNVQNWNSAKTLSANWNKSKQLKQNVFFAVIISFLFERNCLESILKKS